MANIFSAVVVVIFFILFGITISSNTSKDIVRNYKSSEQIFLEESNSNSLNSVLKVDEAITGEPMSRLVAKRVFYREEILDFDGHQVNITKEFKILLDKVYGEGNYFVKVEALIYDLTLIFVFDGSDSMTEERGELADKLPGLLESLEQQSNLSIREMVYILSEDGHLCDIFTNKNISCETIDPTDMYLPFYQQCSDLNADYRSKYCIVAPFVHNWWEMSNRQRNWQEWSERWRAQYYQCDWGAGITYALHRADTSLSNVNILFPISEELSTCSFSQKCFTDYADGELNWQAIYCDICHTSDNEPTIARAHRSIDAALRMSEDVLNDVIIPIYSYVDPCEYEYFIQNRHRCLEYYFTVDPGGGPSTPADGTYCGIPECEGCQDTGSKPGPEYVCLHPEVQSIILAHMDELAKATAGSVVNISDVHQLTDMIDHKINETLNSLFFTVGKEQNKNSIGFERLLTLPGAEGNFARLRLWRYFD